MKKLLIATLALAVSAGVNAQENTGGYGTIGGVATTTVAAGVVGLAVAAAVISNNRGSSVDSDDTGGELVRICNAGDAAPVNNICTGTETIVTGTGTGTSTMTVTFTYVAGVAR